MNTLIKADDIWLLWAIIIGWAAISIMLEQRFSWAQKITGAVVALLGAMFLANIRVIPTASPVYDSIWEYVIPVAIPMLLFQADIRKIWKESGRMLGAFWIAALGTCIGTVVATLLLKDVIPELGEIAGMMSASYIGGGVNFVAMTAVFHPDENLVNATIVADNLVMASFFFIYMFIAASPFFRKRFKLSYDQLDNGADSTSEAQNQAANFWGKKEISLKDIAYTVAIAVAIAAASAKIGLFFGNVFPDSGNFLVQMLGIILSNQYFLITIITVTLVAVFSDFFAKLTGGQEIGTFLVYLFFVVLGVPASIRSIIENSPMLFVFCVIIAAFNLLVCLLAAKFKKLTLEESLLAANATIGGPTTGAAMAISKGWTQHVVPALLCGLSGYVFGNFIGLIMGTLMIKLIG